MTLAAGIATWCAALVLIALLSARPAGARAGLFVAVLLLPLPVFVKAAPLSRLLLACFVGASFFRAADFWRAPPAGGFRTRLAFLCAYFDASLVTRRAPRFDATSFATLVASTIVLTTAIAVAKTVPADGLWLIVRWIAGGIGLLAIAEMATACHDLATATLGLAVPPLFLAPYRATSVAEFWARRWNVPASEALHVFCFKPVARYGVSFAMVAAFTVSAAGHAFLASLALKGWRPAASCGAFFLVQPLIIVIERKLKVRRWSEAAARIWTLGWLSLTAPLVVEPVIQMAEKVWGGSDELLLPTIAVLGFCILVSLITATTSFTLSRSQT
jgi:hypothetical protein